MEIDMDMGANVEHSASGESRFPGTGHYRAAVLTGISEAIRAQAMPLQASTYIKQALKEPDNGKSKGARGMRGRYSFDRMGVSLEIVHGFLGLAAYEALEHDDDVVAVFDRPPALRLRQHNGRRAVGFLMRPTLAVLRRTRTVLVEVIPDQVLRKRLREGSTVYEFVEGQWICPSAQSAAAQMGFEHEVWTESWFNNQLVANLRMLEDYYLEMVQTEAMSAGCELVRSAVAASGSATASEVLARVGDGAGIDDIFRSIARGAVHVDLSGSDLARPDEVRLFSERAQLEAFTNSEVAMARAGDWNASAPITLEVRDEVLWDGVVYEVTHVGANEVAFRLDGKTIRHSVCEVHELLSQGVIKPLRAARVLAEVRRDDALDMISRASPEHLAVANARLTRIEPFLAGLQHAPSSRTLRRYLANYRHSETSYGNGFVGLIPKFGASGNRERRLSKEVLEIVNRTVVEKYCDPRNINRHRVHGEIALACEQAGLPAPSYSWFCRFLKTLNQFQLKLAREGKKAANQIAPRGPTGEGATVDVEPVRAFERAHLDHTQIDLETIFEDTAENLGRPWLSVLIDHASRRILGFFLSYEPPSYRCALMVVRDCVRRYHRLPDLVVVDGGKEFRSIWFQTFCAYFQVQVIYRPPGKPRFGAQMERFFGSDNTMLLHNLTGNTQLTKNVRQMTPAQDPAKHALWTLPALYELYERFLFEIYDTLDHRGILMPPRTAFHLSAERYGTRDSRFIAYTENFLILTCPSTRTGRARVTPNGVKINYFWFNAQPLYPLVGQDIKIRYEPYDLSIAWGYVGGRWIKLISRFDRILRGLTGRQLWLLTELYRKRRGDVERHRLNDKKLVDFLQLVEKEEEVLLERKRVAALRAAQGNGENCSPTEEGPDYTDYEGVEPQDDPEGEDAEFSEDDLLDCDTY